LNKPLLVSRMILVFPKDIASKTKKSLKNVWKKTEDHLADVLSAVKKNKISERDVKDVLFEIFEGKSFDDAIKKEKIDLSEVEEKIHKIIKEKPGLSDKAYMGLVMKEFKGKVDGKSAMEIIGKYVK